MSRYGSKKKLTLKEVREFRRKYRNAFLVAVAQILAETESITDDIDRLHECEVLAKRKIDKYPWFGGLIEGPISLVLNEVSLLGSTDAATELRKDVFYLIGKHVPLYKDRWVYWFKNRAR